MFPNSMSFVSSRRIGLDRSMTHGISQAGAAWRPYASACSTIPVQGRKTPGTAYSDEGRGAGPCGTPSDDFGSRYGKHGGPGQTRTAHNDRDARSPTGARTRPQTGADHTSNRSFEGRPRTGPSKLINTAADPISMTRRAQPFTRKTSRGPLSPFSSNEPAGSTLKPPRPSKSRVVLDTYS